MNTTFYLDPRFQQMFNCLDDGIFIADHSGKALWLNETSTKQIGASAEQIIGRNVTELEGMKMFTPSVTNIVLQKRETVSQMQTSRNRQLLATGYLLKIEDEDIEYVLVHVKDITETVRSSLKLEKAEAVIKQYVEELRQAKSQRIETNEKSQQLIGKGKKHQEVLDLMERVSTVDATLLILGETGVGKSIVAKNIHDKSERARHPFVQINCSAIPASLLESELFGYKKGAFTGADHKGKTGMVQEAKGGTLLLDEIGDLPFDLQPKLLQLLQEKTYTPIGGTKAEQADIRIIAATNSDLSTMVADKQFREDLYYRLNVLSIQVPPLREREEDIQSFVHHYMDHYNTKYKRNCVMTNEVLDILQDYEWPGNVRELENIMERLVITAKSDVILKEDLPEKLVMTHKKPGSSFSIHGAQSLTEHLENVEKEAITEAINEYGSTRKAADALGITQSAFMRRVRKYEITLSK
ncbi:sigma-54 interaction domain-containing protein [Natribacillus halophilus]|uniref:HTH-type transcriptional regulatory protein TyrR n=1 Tax=Natribacillus halophilus TaxID=549003 RepID=A0A1G8JYM4_9BACI|nr:sigma 54-interacting transcriptional regulator [Natribacillus halophilus]SDI35650.1 PAS domain S-box-containing protein [Natribacillus halophilus]